RDRLPAAAGRLSDRHRPVPARAAPARRAAVSRLHPDRRSEAPGRARGRAHQSEDQGGASGLDFRRSAALHGRGRQVDPAVPGNLHGATMTITKAERSHYRPPKFIRVIRARPRLFIAIALGSVIALALATLTSWRVASSLLVGWDVCVGLYLALAFHTMSRADVHHMRRRARLQDEGQFGILILTAVAALASL